MFSFEILITLDTLNIQSSSMVMYRKKKLKYMIEKEKNLKDTLKSPEENDSSVFVFTSAKTE